MTPWFDLPTQTSLDIKCCSSQHASPVVIIGAGLAGCNLAYQLALRGIQTLVIEAGNSIASGASSNPVAVVKPFVTRQPSDAHDFYAKAFDYLLRQLASEHLRNRVPFKQCGVLQLTHQQYPNNNMYQGVSSETATKLAGVKIASNALWFEQGGWLNPKQYCSALLTHPLITVQLNSRLINFKCEPTHCTLEVKTDTATKLITTPRLLLANGIGLHRFSQTEDVPITPAKGQLSCITNNVAASLTCVVSGKHYVIPDNQRLYIGASFHRNDESLHVSEIDHASNIDGLQSMGLQTVLSNTEQSQQPEGFTGVRATTPDRLPVVGLLPDFNFYREQYATLHKGYLPSKYPSAKYLPGTYLLGGFGSRGLVSAAYSASLLANQLCVNSALSATTLNSASNCEPKLDTLETWAALLHPARFFIRNQKRNQ